VQIKTRRIWKSLVDEDSTMIVYSNDIESNVVKIVVAQNSTKRGFEFHSKPRFTRFFTTTELLMMERKFVISSLGLV
jgi:hypothetical protein